MTRRIFVLRHGQTQFNAEQKLQGHCNSPLTDKGLAQARSVGTALSGYLGERTYRVYASPLGRAVQTATIVCEQVGHCASEIVQDERLKEFALGEWEQRTIPSLVAEQPDLLSQSDWYLQAPQSESYQSVKARLLSWLNELPEDGDVVVVSHALTGAALRGALMDMSYEQVWEQDLPQDAFFMIENGVMNRIDCLVELETA